MARVIKTGTSFRVRMIKTQGERKDALLVRAGRMRSVSGANIDTVPRCEWYSASIFFLHWISVSVRRHSITSAAAACDPPF